MAYLQAWDEGAPLGSEDANTLETIIQNFKTAVRERMDDVMLDFGVDGTEPKIMLEGTGRLFVDLEANKPADVDGNEGEGFYETDTGKLFIHDGSTWVHVNEQSSLTLPAAVAARIYKNADQEISDNIDTLVTWNAEDYDFGDLADLPTNNDRLTVPDGEGGLYHLDAMVTLDPLTASSDGGIFQRLRIEVSGTEYLRKDKVVFVQNGVTRPSSIMISADMQLSQTQYVQAFIRHDRTATGIQALGQFSRTWMSLRKVD